MYGMSINRINLPEIKVLKSYLKENGSEMFYNSFVRKREAFIGSDKSVDFIDHFCKEYFKDESSETI